MRRDNRTEMKQRPVPLPEVITEADRAAHAAFVSTLGPKPLWLSYQHRTDAGAA